MVHIFKIKVAKKQRQKDAKERNNTKNANKESVQKSDKNT